MDKIKRDAFLKKIAVIVAGSLIVPEFLSGKAVPGNSFPVTTGTTSASVQQVFNQYAIIDLHCHPSLKMYLLDRKIWRRHLLHRPGSNLVHMQEDVREFAAGNVSGIIAAHYLVEAGIKKNWGAVSLLLPVLKKLFFPLTDKIEHEDYSNFTQVNIMIDTLESQIHIANEKQKKVRFVIARNCAEFEEALKTPGTIPIAHSIEGAHALGRNFPISPEKLKKGKLPGEGKMLYNNDPADATLYIRNLLALKARGVCMITLGHFFENDLVYPVEGISPDGKKLPGFCWCYDPANDNFPLKPVGEAVVRKMLEIGMIVDLTHSTPKAREQVFAINAERAIPRPLMFSHAGSQAVFEKYNNNKFPDYKYYDVSAADIKSIEDCNGIIGVIPENFWLAGGDTHLKKYGLDPGQFRFGIPFMIETMKNINSQTTKKDYDNVAIGTDFDGLADNPKDLYLNSQLVNLVSAMKADGGFTPEQITKITSGNARRVLQNGWD